MAFPVRTGTAVLLLAVVGALQVNPRDWSVDEVFATGDTDGNNMLDKHEFEWVLRHFGFEPGQFDAAGNAAPVANYGAGAAGGLAALTAGAGSFWEAFTNSVLMIFATEIGDKTFFIAAVLAMRHSRAIIFTGAVGALALMTVLSAIMGFALPSLMPRKYTHLASAGLMLYFGCRLIKDASEMQGSGPSEELIEVEEELVAKKDEEGGAGDGAQSREHGGGGGPDPNAAFAVLTQAFTLTFLAEWGDRSQIATIALAAAKDPIGVTAGGIVGHSCCTGIAVVGGRMLAARISEKAVAYVGGSLFLCFAAHAFFFGSPETGM